MIFLSSLFLGILTSISPCPLATNITAVSFVAKKISKPSAVLLYGSLYTLGRTVMYMLLSGILALGITNAPVLSSFLQKYGVYIQIPFLILIGLILLDVVTLKFKRFSISEESKQRLSALGPLGAFLLGTLFALMICPVSAALFFGNLLQEGTNPLSVFLYGVGTGLPVLLFAFLTAFFVNKIAGFYNKIVMAEVIFRMITGIVFILAGLYFLAGLLF